MQNTVVRREEVQAQVVQGLLVVRHFLEVAAEVEVEVQTTGLLLM